MWSIRTTDSLRSSKLKQVRIMLMYVCWESMIICQMRLQVILIPSNQVQGPKSVSLYFSFISTLNWLISSLELPVTMQLSMWTAKMMTHPSAHFLMKVLWSASVCSNPSCWSASSRASYQFLAPCFKPYNTLRSLNTQQQVLCCLYPFGCSMKMVLLSFKTELR